MPANSLPTPDREPLKRSTFWILASVTVLLILNWVAAVARFQVNVPIWDQWDFFNPLFNGESLFDLFNYQHGPHRQGLAFIFSSWIMAGSHWDSRIESLWMVALLVTCALLALQLKWRMTGRMVLTDMCIPFLVLTLAQWGSVISVPNASHSVFPLLLLLISAHVWLYPKNSLRLPASGALAVFSIFTGFGLFTGIMLTALLIGSLLRAWGLRLKNEQTWSSLGLLIAAFGWIAFSRGYHFNPASEGYSFPHQPLFDYVRFLALMLAHPAGWDFSTVSASTFGGVLLIACLGAFASTTWQCFRDGDPRHAEAAFLLLGSGLAFAAFTAVGRIHLGQTAGMASRYITLLIPLWLGLISWGAMQTRPALRHGTIVLAWSVALLPLTSLLQRPASNWLGTAGLSEASRLSLADSTNEKMAWVSLYLRSGDFREADRVAGRLIHPAGESIGLDRKLDWLKSRQLSFFKSSSSPNAWQPWQSETRCLWLRAHNPELNERWMADDCALWIQTDHDSFVNFEVVQPAPNLPRDARLEFTHRQITGSESADFLSEVISLPVSKGEQVLTIRSTTGSVAANHPHDNRRISYRLSNAWATSRPAGVEWTPSDSNRPHSVWTPRYRWRVVSGFHGWERPAPFGWSDAFLQLEVDTGEPVYLNVQIDKRYHPVASGPVFVRQGDRRIEIPMPDDRLTFSIPIAASSAPQLLHIENAAGAASPHTSEGKADTRSLALRLGHLSVSSTAKFTPLTETR